MPHLDNNARKVLQSRYLRRNHEHDLIETPTEMFYRVAKAVARAEVNYGAEEKARYWEGHFFTALDNLWFLPNSPTLMNAGARGGQLSACFVLPIEDDMSSIFTTLRDTAIIQKSGGGTGFNFSRLRPGGSYIRTTGGKASGPVSFMKIFDAATENIKQGGKRRGANMGVLNVDHPDIFDFVACKRREGVLKNFNLSVGMSDRFMTALEQNEDWALVHPATGKKVDKVSARKLWGAIVQNAWEHGDPGLVFFDTVNRKNPLPHLGTIQATNPCGEMPLLPYESCNLGSINLARMLTKKDAWYEIDWDRLDKVINIAIRFLDNVIDVNNYRLEEIKALTLSNRKIGLGVMGWAELLIKLKIPYNSAPAIELAERLMDFISKKGRQASHALVRERGTFPNWHKSLFYPKLPLRNATCTSIAPTGSISIIAGTSSSIEPIYALAFSRDHVLKDEKLTDIHPLLIDFLEKANLDADITRSILEKGFIAEGEATIPKKTREVFRTALQIPYEYHIKHQLAFQKSTDNAVSKTINLPFESTLQDVSDAFKMAWRLGAKGITVYRNKSKRHQVLNAGVEEKACKVCL